MRWKRKGGSELLQAPLNIYVCSEGVKITPVQCNFVVLVFWIMGYLFCVGASGVSATPYIYNKDLVNQT